MRDAARTFDRQRLHGSDVRTGGFSATRGLRDKRNCVRPRTRACTGMPLSTLSRFRIAGFYRSEVGINSGVRRNQRLPRVVGIARAAEMVALGNFIRAPQALEWGLVDRVVEGDILSAATEYARHAAEVNRQPRRTRDLTEAIGESPNHVKALIAIREQSRKKYRGELPVEGGRCGGSRGPRLISGGLPLRIEAFRRVPGFGSIQSVVPCPSCGEGRLQDGRTFRGHGQPGESGWPALWVRERWERHRLRLFEGRNSRRPRGKLEANRCHAAWQPFTGISQLR